MNPVQLCQAVTHAEMFQALVCELVGQAGLGEVVWLCTGDFKIGMLPHYYFFDKDEIFL